MEFDALSTTFGARFLAPSAARIGATYTAYDQHASAGEVERESSITHSGSTLDINRHLPAQLARRKSLTTSCLRRHAIAVPHEIVLPNALWSDSFPSLESLRAFATGQEIVVKPDEGTKGRGVSLHRCIESALHASRLLGDGGVVLQHRAHGPELRVYVLLGRIVGGYWRRQHDGFGNLSTGEIPVLFIGPDLPPDVAHTAVQATHHLGLDYAGLDIIQTHDGPVVLEANASPQFAAAAHHVGGDAWSNTMLDDVISTILAYHAKPR